MIQSQRKRHQRENLDLLKQNNDGREQATLSNQGWGDTLIEKTQIRQHMQVRGSDGQPIGKVDKLEGNRIKLTKNSINGQGEHRYIDFDAVMSVKGDILRLDKTAEAAEREFQARQSESGGSGPIDI
jgi:hypothetical protein